MPEPLAKWLAGLAKEGLVLPEDGGDPDIAKGRAALKACAQLEPPTEESASFGAPQRLIAVPAAAPVRPPTPPTPTTTKAG